MLSRLVAGARRMAHDMQPDCMDGRDAAEQLTVVAEGARLFDAMTAMLAKRVDATGVWKLDGYRSAAHFVAAKTGRSVGEAVGLLETARRLEELPATEEAFRAGRLSTPQAREVSAAAIEAPQCEGELLQRAVEDGYAGVKAHAAQVKANALSADEERERHERIQRSRHVRFWHDADGADCGQWRMTPDAGARFRAGLRAEQELIFRQARTEGRRESNEAYAADALLALAERAALGCGEGSRPAPKPKIIMRVDVDALRRGTTDGEETCDIRGVGPVPVATARDALGDALLDIVITKGVDVLNVTHVGRTRLAPIQTALEWLYNECAVAGCHQRDHLEYHHTDPFRRTGYTKLKEVIPLCRHHHHFAEHRGFILRLRPDGQYDLVPLDGDLDDEDERGPPASRS